MQQALGHGEEWVPVTGIGRIVVFGAVDARQMAVDAVRSSLSEMQCSATVYEQETRTDRTELRFLSNSVARTKQIFDVVRDAMSKTVERVSGTSIGTGGGSVMLSGCEHGHHSPAMAGG